MYNRDCPLDAWAYNSCVYKQQSALSLSHSYTNVTIQLIKKLQKYAEQGAFPVYFKTKPHLTFSYIYIFFPKLPEYQLFPISHQSSGEEMADIQAMFNATRPWLLLITVITDRRSNFLSAFSFN